MSVSTKGVLWLGDSNFWKTYDKHGERLAAEVNEEVAFKVCSTNDSLKLSMEKIEASPKIVLIGTPLNEIATKIKDGKKKGKDETIKLVIEAQNKLVNQYAEFHTETIFVLVPPLPQEGANLDGRENEDQLFLRQGLHCHKIPVERGIGQPDPH